MEEHSAGTVDGNEIDVQESLVFISSIQTFLRRLDVLAWLASLDAPGEGFFVEIAKAAQLAQAQQDADRELLRAEIELRSMGPGNCPFCATPAVRVAGVGFCENCGAGCELNDAERGAWCWWPCGATELWIPPVERFAAEALKCAQEAAFRSTDPLVALAFEAAKIAVDTIAGYRRLPTDALDALSVALRGGEPKDSEDALFRALCELIERRVVLISPTDGARAMGSVNTEAPLLRRDVIRLCGERAGTHLSERFCANLLDRLSAKRPRLKLTGAVADLVVQARLLPALSEEPDETERRALLQRISSARQRGTSGAKREPVRKRKQQKRRGVRRVGRHTAN